MPSTLTTAAAEALQDFLKRISNPAAVHRLHNYMVFTTMTGGNFTTCELGDLNALGDLLVRCHALHAAQFTD